MTKAELHELAEKYAISVEVGSEGPGKFRHLYLGIGESPTMLTAFQRLLANRNVSSTFTHVNNPGHKDYKKSMLEIRSFWYE